MASSSYYKLVYELPAAEEELFSVELWARGVRGLEVEEHGANVRLVAYCDDPPPSALASSSSWPRRGIRLLRRERHRERDWLAVHRRYCRPLEIGERFLIDPREPGAALPASGRILLRVPARRAFGTGAHESTRLVLEWLEELDLRGRSVLDLGAGSGILSMAALRLGAGTAVALDIDPVAAFVAHETVRLNGLEMWLIAGGLACLEGASFDLALVNILPHHWLDEAASLTRLLAAAGCVIVSGVPIEDAGEVAERLSALAWLETERRAAGEWIAMQLVRRTA